MHTKILLPILVCISFFTHVFANPYIFKKPPKNNGANTREKVRTALHRLIEKKKIFLRGKNCFSWVPLLQSISVIVSGLGPAKN